MKVSGRDLSDEALLSHLAAFLTYEAGGGGMCFVDWTEAQAFTYSDRLYLEVGYMGATVLPGLGA